ncbi:MAG TPA: nuclear transport factor 2 family protein [Ilumatobacter sp.]|nr:nuclear transport factor 2 family protein [Ilumatobacter sp.]
MTPLEVALSYLDALGGDDPEAVAAHVSDDFSNEHQSELGAGCVGRDAYRGRLPGFMATFPNRHYTVVDTVADDTTAAIRYRFGADVGGHRIDIPGVMWFGVRDGLITRRVDTWDSLTFFRQTDQTPPATSPTKRTVD